MADRINLGIVNCLPEKDLPKGYKKPLVNTFPSYDSIKKLTLVVLKPCEMPEIVNDLKKQVSALVSSETKIQTFGAFTEISENETSFICEVDLYIKNLT